MPRRLTPTTTLEHLKRDAKRWLKALRANDQEARARLARAVPDATDAPALRHVQHALARELGFPGWAALKRHVEKTAHVDEPREVLVARFLDNACPDHHVRGGRDHLRARSTAMHLLDRFPDVAHASFYTAVVCGDIETVERVLAEQPELASTRDATPSAERANAGGSGDLAKRDLGPKGWEPLLYLCFTRLPLPAVSENAVAIARTLLDHGADPNAYFMAGSSRYTPLVGAIGEGEEDRPPHPRRDALVRLLLERGAEPCDGQVIYNIHFHGRVLWFLELMYEFSLRLGRKADWDDPEWSMLSQGNYGSGARWHLWLAIEHDDVQLAEWCLAHGANPNAVPPSDRRLPQGTPYEYAMRHGRTEIAELLVRHGAARTAVVLDGMDAFTAACMRLDRDEVTRQLAAHPEYLNATEPLFAAARRDRADVAAMLLDLGMSPEVENRRKERPLHVAAYANALRVAKLLLERGAAIDPVESNWSNTPLACAVYYQHREMIDLLAPLSRDVWELTYTGNVDRLRELFAADPGLAHVVADGQTPLMWLPPHDEACALETARLLLAHGANPTLRTTDGMTAADRAERLGMYEVAELLRGSASQSDSE